MLASFAPSFGFGEYKWDVSRGETDRERNRVWANKDQKTARASGKLDRGNQQRAETRWHSPSVVQWPITTWYEEQMNNTHLMLSSCVRVLKLWKGRSISHSILSDFDYVRKDTKQRRVSVRIDKLDLCVCMYVCDVELILLRPWSIYRDPK